MVTYKSYIISIVVLIVSILIIVFALVGTARSASNWAPFMFVAIALGAILGIGWSSMQIDAYRKQASKPKEYT